VLCGTDCSRQTHFYPKRFFFFTFFLCSLYFILKEEEGGGKEIMTLGQLKISDRVNFVVAPSVGRH
jgi:hypothetical protein